MPARTAALGRHASRWSDLAAVLFLALTVSVLYGARLTHQPIVGEESRWANAAREMIQTGDWLVPRQQSRVFPERPPVTIWGMAVVGSIRGDVDTIAVRLPSVIAIVLTSLLIYGYARAFLTGFGALAAGLIYATFAQVLQIGQLGESEAMFALLVSASLFTWHLGYTHNWGRLAAWSLGFAFAALAAMVKGPQAPVYFVAITAAYLAHRRDWRYLICWQFLAAACVFPAIIATWMVPFYRATNWHCVASTWAGLAADRFHLAGVLAHIVTFPLETFACLLPWSPILVALVHPKTRKLLADQRPLVSFLTVAIIVAYPTVWIAAGARGRYFMPLYPIVAVLIALVIERCSAAVQESYPRRAWHQFLLLASALMGAIGVFALIPARWSLGQYQPTWFSGAFALLTLGAIAILWLCFVRGTAAARTVAVVTIALVAGIIHSGIMINYNAARWSNPAAVVAELKQQVPRGTNLVSFSPLEHRFIYFYNEPIPELSWPLGLADLPENVDYFFFMRNPGDTAEKRDASRGRVITSTVGTLPFAWEEITSICVERRLRDQPQPTIVLGRVTRPVREMLSDATVPQNTTAQKAKSTQRK